MDPNTVELVNAAIVGDRDAVLAAFNDSIATKVSDALEIKKVEIASNLLGIEQEVSNEVEGSETEVDGSTDAAADVEAAESESATEES